MSKQPNIIFFFSDQQRWDTCGCYGQPLPVTPNLDRMASEGVRFENAFTCQPVCGPARACLQTGKYATEVGCFRNGIALPLDSTTVAQQMSQAGYEVGYIGKWHLASTNGMGEADVDFREKPVPMERRGGYKDFWIASDVLEFTSHSYDGGMFDGDGNFREFTGYRADSQTDFVLEYLDTRTQEKPFFLFLSYIEPHHQNDHNCYEGPHGSKEQFADYVPPQDLVDKGGDWRENYPDYLGCCHSLDANLGRIRDKLEELGMGDDTLIIYTSDHGSHFRTRNGEYKRACHEGCIRVPLVVHGPGFQGGKVVDRLASLIDLPQTVLAAGGAEIPEDWQGNPLQKALDPSQDWPEEVFLQISESQVGRAIRTDRWKYSVVAPGGKGWQDAGAARYVEEFLYDLDADPFEANNLVADPALAGVRAELRERLVARMVAANEAAPDISPAAAN
jgi:uncharacterized sulfatase